MLLKKIKIKIQRQTKKIVHTIKFFLFAIKKCNKIIVVAHESTKSGAPLLALNIAKKLKELHFSVAIISLERGGPLDKFFHENSDCFLDRPSLNIFKHFSKFHLKVVLNSIISGKIVGFLSSYGYKTICLIHELPDTVDKYLCFSNQQLYDIRTKPNYVVFSSFFNKNLFENRYGPVFTNSCVIPQGLYNAYDIRLTKKEACEIICKKYHLTSKQYVCACGDTSYNKGFDFFVHLALNSSSLDCTFVWVGNIIKDNIDAVLAKNSILALPENILLLNYLDDPKELNTIFKGSLYFLMLSRLDAFPSVVLESMYNGTPVICFQGCGGFVDIVNNSNGFVIEKGCIYDIYKILRDTLNKEINYQTMSANAANLMKEKYDFMLYVKTLVGLLEGKNE